jgi:hypothetical protein
MGMRRRIGILHEPTAQVTGLSPAFDDVAEQIGLVRNWLSEEHIDYKAVENMDESRKRISWTTQCDPGISIYNSIYSDKEGEFFLWHEAAIARVEAPSRALLHFLLNKNATFFVPYRFALNDDNLILIQLRVYLGGITLDHLDLRLNSLIPFSQAALADLQENFGIEPFIRDYHSA